MNPNDLPAELLPFYKSMQADYTRKTQEAKAQIEEATARAAAADQRLGEITGQMSTINDYVARLEDANTKWLAYYEDQDAMAKATAAATGTPGNPGTGGNPGNPAGHLANPGFTAAESRALSTDPGKLTKEQLSQLDEYFEAKYGKSFQTLSSGMDKLSKQLGFKLQMDDVIRTRMKEIPDIDPQRILKTAVETNTLDAREAFERAYSTELRDIEVKKEVERQLAERAAAEKTKVVEGVSAILGDHFYTRPEGAFSTYEEATAAALKEIAAGS